MSATERERVLRAWVVGPWDIVLTVEDDSLIGRALARWQRRRDKVSDMSESTETRGEG